MNKMKDEKEISEKIEFVQNGIPVTHSNIMNCVSKVKATYSKYPSFNTVPKTGKNKMKEIIPDYIFNLIDLSIDMIEGEIYPKEMIEMVPGMLRKVIKQLERRNTEEFEKELNAHLRDKRMADTDYLLKNETTTSDAHEFLYEIVNASTEEYRKMKIYEFFKYIESWAEQ